MPALRPLDGITVIALEHAVAAPVCTRHLADLGARVIKIERPGAGDFARGYDKRVNGISSYFAWANRSKESLSLDLKHDEAQRILAKLLDKADVLVQNLAPGAAARMGLSAEALRPDHPRLIVCDISGYGKDGPYRDKKAYDLMIQAEAGLIASTGTPESMARAGFSAADTSAGMYAYSSILAALLLREKTGEGSAIDISMLETLGEWMSNPMYYAYDGQPPAPRTGAFHPTVVPYGPFVAGDGSSIMMGLQNEREWTTFCEAVLHDPALARDERFNSNTQRTANRPALEVIIREKFSGMSGTEVEASLEAANMATARVNSPADIWDHPQHKARQRWHEVDSSVGKVKAMLPPGVNDHFEYRMDGIPGLGQHTEAILSELGYSAEAITALRAEQVI